MAYNIFTALGLERKELIHSAMIVAIASYKGNEVCRDLFFEMLANKGDREKIMALKNAIIEEKYSNWINTEHKLIERVGSKVRDRGRADIWLGNKGKKPQHSYRLVIENKIYAGNQDHQLRRYFRYLTGEERINAGLFYLCLKDDKERRASADKSAEIISKTETNQNPTKYNIITYQDDITCWLNQILGLKNLDEDFRKAVQQYLAIIYKIK